MSHARTVSYACLLWGSLGLVSCSSRLEIITRPEGAEIMSAGGEVVARTPASLEAAQISKLGDAEGALVFKLRAPGHVSRWVVTDAATTRTVNLELSKLDPSTFSSEFLDEHSQEVNRLLRRAFELQKLLQGRDLAKLQSELDSFRKDYPQLAFAHVLAARVAASQGKKEEALRHLGQARQLDPKDPSLRQVPLPAPSPSRSPEGPPQ